MMLFYYLFIYFYFFVFSDATDCYGGIFIHTYLSGHILVVHSLNQYCSSRFLTGNETQHWILSR